MVCPKCSSTVSKGATFCSTCGEKLQYNQPKNCAKYCRVCGQIIKEGNKFCGKCGTAVATVVPPNIEVDYDIEETSSAKIVISYFISIISAIVSFVIRIATQQTHYYWENLLDNKELLGIDSDSKPFLTAIPVVAAIIVSLLIVSDKNVSLQKKTIAFIVNAIFIALAVLFIWFDIPYDILDF